MNNDLERFEETLKELSPAPLSDKTKAEIKKIPDLERFEETLKELKPAPLSDETRAALDKIPGTTIEKPSPIPFKRKIWAAAAIILIALLLKFASHEPAAKPGRDEIVKKPKHTPGEVVKVEEKKKPEPRPEDTAPGPFTMDELITAIHDEGIVESEDGTPVRKLRREYIRTLNIRDSRTGKRYTVQEPRSDVVFVSMEQY